MGFQPHADLCQHATAPPAGILSMMHVADIEEALDQDDIPAIQGAFRALIDFPHEEEIEGAESVQTLVRLLDRVVEALRADRNVMPAATCEAIQTLLSTRLLPDATYAAGARIVSEFREQWRTLYRAH